MLAKRGGWADNTVAAKKKFPFRLRSTAVQRYTVVHGTVRGRLRNGTERCVFACVPYRFEFVRRFTQLTRGVNGLRRADLCKNMTFRKALKSLQVQNRKFSSKLYVHVALRSVRRLGCLSTVHVGAYMWLYSIRSCTCMLSLYFDSLPALLCSLSIYIQCRHVHERTGYFSRLLN